MFTAWFKNDEGLNDSSLYKHTQEQFFYLIVYKAIKLVVFFLIQEHENLVWLPSFYIFVCLSLWPVTHHS